MYKTSLLGDWIVMMIKIHILLERTCDEYSPCVALMHQFHYGRYSVDLARTIVQVLDLVDFKNNEWVIFLGMHSVSPPRWASPLRRPPVTPRPQSWCGG